MAGPVVTFSNLGSAQTLQIDACLVVSALCFQLRNRFSFYDDRCLCVFCWLGNDVEGASIRSELLL